MMNPDMYFRDTWKEEEATDETACSSNGKSKPRLRHGQDHFTYTVERLQGGCLLYQLALVRQNRGMIAE
jgi:hypothetical protein